MLFQKRNKIDPNEIYITLDYYIKIIILIVNYFDKIEVKMDKFLFEKAMEMPPNERVAFAELILQSIDFENEEIRDSWMEEVKDRMNAVKEGKSQLIDFEARYIES